MNEVSASMASPASAGDHHNDLFDTPKHPDLVYDIGMHKGEDAEFYLRKGFRVIAFEADPDLIRLCEGRLQSYVNSGQLTIIQRGVAP